MQSPHGKGKVTITYLESSFPVELLRCPQYGLVYIPEDLAVGKCSRWKKPWRINRPMGYCKTYENPKIHAVTGNHPPRRFCPHGPGGGILLFCSGGKGFGCRCGLGATVEYLVDNTGWTPWE